ncbi:MAG: methylmalonyl-CoA epimerase [Acidobacteriota bacterium]
MIKKIDHIAIAVKDLNKEIELYKSIPGFTFEGTEVVEEQKVTVAFFKVGDVFLELLEPLSEDSPISGFLDKRGGGIHHIAYEVDNVKNQIGQFEEKGIRMLNKEPKTGAHNAKIAFAHPKGFSGVLVEVKEKGE